MAREQDRRISEVVERERSRLLTSSDAACRSPRDAEDVLQDVFYRAGRGESPADADRPRHRLAVPRRAQSHHRSVPQEDGRNASAISLSLTKTTSCCSLEELLPSPDAGPEALVRAPRAARGARARDRRSCRRSSASVFVAHELEGRSFKEIAAETGVSVNTLLSAQALCGAASARAAASACTTNSRKHEGRHETKVDVHRAGGPAGYRARRLHRRRDRAPALELAAAAAVRAGARSRSGRRLVSWRCAASFLAARDSTAVAAATRVSASASAIAWRIAWRSDGTT